MIEGIYFFGDQLRWNLGWPNPNVAGAFVAMLLAVAFSSNLSLNFNRWSTRITKVFLISVEVGLLFLLCKTYSRGALFALMVGFIYICLIQFVSSGRSSVKSLILKSWLPRILGFIALLTLTGFWARVAPTYVSSDASVGNRMILWKGGLEMMSLKPWAGWGVGQSGSQFMHWFQPLDETAGYAGMVNSYLHIGVERELGVLFAWVFVGLLFVCTPLFMALRSERLNKWSWLAIIGAGVLVVFMAANIFNTLWVFPKLWIPVLFSLGAIGLGFVLGSKEARRKILGQALVWALLSSGTCIGRLTLTGRVLHEKRPEKFKVRGPLVVFAPEMKASSPANRVILYAETSVFGEDWGKEVRRLAWALKAEGVQVVAPRALTGSEFTDELVPEGEGLWTVITSSIKPLMNNKLTENATKIILLHPGERPPETLSILSDKLQIWLPTLDISGMDGLWRREAKKRSWEVTNSGSFSQDVRSVWPGIVLK